MKLVVNNQHEMLYIFNKDRQKSHHGIFNSIAQMRIFVQVDFVLVNRSVQHDFEKGWVSNFSFKYMGPHVSLNHDNLGS